MSRHWAIGLVAIALLFSSSAVAAPQKSPPTDAPCRFVGYSSSTPADLVAGTGGLPPLYAACQDPMTGFGPDARMSTTKEFVESPNIDVPTPVNAWIYPTFIGYDGTTALDFSGIKGPPDELTCGAWTSDVGGLIVNNIGGFRRVGTCTTPRQVTCCVPTQ